MRSPLTLAAAQLPCVPGDIDKNVASHVAVLAEAAASGARLVLFTELSLVGYELGLIAANLPELAVQEGDSRLGPLRAACARYGVYAVVGAVLPVDGGYTLSALVFDDQGAVRLSYAKHHLHGIENEMFIPGTDFGLFELDGHRLGLAICADLNYPEHAAGTVAAGAEIYLAGALYLSGKQARRDLHLSSRAAENNCWTVLSAYTGEFEGNATTGGSGVWSPDGVLCARAEPDASHLVFTVPDQSWSPSDSARP
ncbi:carbon-nitrogen hydrolase family protein [Nocardia acidivorans]|uniref:carbon-nitrogen hydrolase family protein n=1 Tax=Nocardia acidivorans TaxID=404580 RepID=UPI00082B69A1|nr:carbon-nitrogen hydrolase family protein [Nocardia acidivorans]